MDLKRGIDHAVGQVLDFLKGLSKNVSSKEEIAQVGTISANNDSSIGDLISDAMEKVGNEGVITVEEAKGTDTFLETVDGCCETVANIQKAKKDVKNINKPKNASL